MFTKIGVAKLINTAIESFFSPLFLSWQVKFWGEIQITGGLINPGHQNIFFGQVWMTLDKITTACPIFAPWFPIALMLRTWHICKRRNWILHEAYNLCRVTHLNSGTTISLCLLLAQILLTATTQQINMQQQLWHQQPKQEVCCPSKVARWEVLGRMFYRMVNHGRSSQHFSTATHHCSKGWVD